MPPKQPAMGERHALPAGTRNPVTPVTHSSLGLSAPKRRLPPSSRGRLGGVSEALPPVGAVAPLLLGGAGDQALAPHDAANGPLAGACHGGDAPVAACAAAGLERLDDRLSRCGALFGFAFGLGVPGVLVAALGHASHRQDLTELILGP